MKSSGIVLLCLTGLLFLACPETPEDEVNPYRQEHISWPSLADSPWPMFQHDPQGTGRSQFSGPQTGQLSGFISDSIYLNGSCVLGSDNAVFFIGKPLSTPETDVVYMVNSGGATVWTFPVAGAFENFITPALAATGSIYLHAHQHRVYSISSDGTELCRLN